MTMYANAPELYLFFVKIAQLDVITDEDIALLHAKARAAGVSPREAEIELTSQIKALHWDKDESELPKIPKVAKSSDTRAAAPLRPPKAPAPTATSSRRAPRPTNCPGCGASVGTSSVCEYCGTSIGGGGATEEEEFAMLAELAEEARKISTRGQAVEGGSILSNAARELGAAFATKMKLKQFWSEAPMPSLPGPLKKVAIDGLSASKSSIAGMIGFDPVQEALRNRANTAINILRSLGPRAADELRVVEDLQRSTDEERQEVEEKRNSVSKKILFASLGILAVMILIITAISAGSSYDKRAETKKWRTMSAEAKCRHRVSDSDREPDNYITERFASCTRLCEAGSTWACGVAATLQHQL